MLAPDPDLLETLRSALEGRPEVREAYLFGSLARGEGRQSSDVDVAVYVDPPALEVKGFGYAAELSADLQSALKRSDVDLVILNKAPPLLYYRVLRDGVRILSRNLEETTARAGYAMSRYFDYVPQLAKIERAYLAAREQNREAK
jgi:predicted nucleotidyltransferase